MSRIAYVNGRYVPHNEAAVHIEDRGYQFADGVYEVVTVNGGRLVDQDPHLDRLEHSLGELRMAWPMSRESLKVVIREVMRRNHLRTGFVYLQITRGVAPRDHSFPADAKSALVVTARHNAPLDLNKARHGVSVITIPDIRWTRRDIKSVSLLPNVLGKQQARDSGAYEAWQVEADGTVTEGTSTNAWIVTKKGELVTRDASHAILSGITRRSLLKIADAKGIRLAERPFTVEEAKDAREAFITSSTSYVKPVISIDGRCIGNGYIGALTSELLDHYVDYMGRADDAIDPGSEARA